MQIGEKEKTVTYPKRQVTLPAPKEGEATPAEGWPVKKPEAAPIAAPEWPVPATVQPGGH